MSEGSVLSPQSVREFFRDLLQRALENQRARVQPFTELYVVNLLHDPQHPSYVALPTLGSVSRNLPVPNLTRG